MEEIKAGATIQAIAKPKGVNQHRVRLIRSKHRMLRSSQRAWVSGV